MVLEDAPVTLALDEDGDVIVPLRFLRGLEAVAQGVRVRMQMFKGEWFLDLSTGVPWWQDILGQRFEYNRVAAALRRPILETPGVTDIVSLSIVFDAQTRLMTVSWVARTAFGDTPEDTLVQNVS